MILAIDQGTTGVTCVVFDQQARVVTRAYREITQHFPAPGWVEHDLTEIRLTVSELSGRVLEAAGCRPGALRAIGIANQRETICVWDPRTGEPLHRAIVWQDRRTASRCLELREAGVEPHVRERTGLVLDPYFSATKIEWLLHHVDGLRERARAGHAVFGTVDSWLIHSLSGELLTDASNASRTMLFDIRRGIWDGELMELLGVADAPLCEVRSSSGEIATTKADTFHGHVVPIAGVAGDQQAALFGQGCVEVGLGKNTYGTGSFLLINLGGAAPKPADGLLGTIAWGIGDRLTYALEASIFVTGAAVQWLRDGIGVIEDAADTAALAASLPSNDGVYFVPALTGLGSPHWDPYARGTIVGLTRGSTRAHLARATLEAIAYQTADAVEAMHAAGGSSLEELRVDGGASANPWLMQFQADVLGIPVVATQLAQSTALGAAYLAGLGIGAWTIEEVRDGDRGRRRYEPSMSVDERHALLHQWRRALERSRGWAQE
jgi:glycerol kinase